MSDDRDAGEAVRTAGEEARKTAGMAADSTRQAADSAQENFSERVLDPARRAGEAMRQSGQAMAQKGSSIGVTMIDQAETNARLAFEAMRAAAQAKDLSDVMKIQGDFLREQGQRNMAQAREIGDLIMQFGRDAVAPMKGTMPE